MTSESGEGAREVVADVASKLFATKIHATDVVIETLERRTDPMQSSETVKPRLAVAIASGTDENATDAALAAEPLAIWAETTLGIVPEYDNGPGCARRRPTCPARPSGWRWTPASTPNIAARRWNACSSSRAAPRRSAADAEAAIRSSA